MSEKSPLQKQRLQYKPTIPDVLKELKKLDIKKGKPTTASSDVSSLRQLFKHTFGQPIIEFDKNEHDGHSNSLRVGVVFSGGQASGGHNVISGLFDAMQEFHEESRLFGFLDGPIGIVENKCKEVTKEILLLYRNQGGFDLIGSGRDKIETPQQLESSLKTVRELELHGLVIIGGDDSNTNAAILAEYFLQNDCQTSVVGVPKTIDGDLQGEHIDISFGFDTACKTYSEMIGNIGCDALSAKKYYHFIRLMGRSASHIALECALKTHPNLALIGEEIAQGRQKLSDIVYQLADLIMKRAEMKKNYGVFLIPEGTIEFIFEVKILINELNQLLASGGEQLSSMESFEERSNYLEKHLKQETSQCFQLLPKEIQEQLLIDRDPHGNVQVSKIETEKLFLKLVESELKSRKFNGKFSGVAHFFGYEGRSALPSNFDANYCYSLGRLSALLVQTGHSGYMACVHELKKSAEKWQIKGIPLTMLMNMETRRGKEKPVIKKYLVDLQSDIFRQFSKLRDSWELEDDYLLAGPIQFYGSEQLTESFPVII